MRSATLFKRRTIRARSRTHAVYEHDDGHIRTVCGILCTGVPVTGETTCLRCQELITASLYVSHDNKAEDAPIVKRTVKRGRRSNIVTVN